MEVGEKVPEISFKRGSKVEFASTRKRLRKLSGATEELLEAAQELPVVTATAPASTVIGVELARVRSSVPLKTPSKTKKRKRAPRRANLRNTLVKDLRKKKRELTKELAQVKRDLKSLRAK